MAQPGSAHAWGAWGRRFKSARPDHFLVGDQLGKVNLIQYSLSMDEAPGAQEKGEIEWTKTKKIKVRKTLWRRR